CSRPFRRPVANRKHGDIFHSCMKSYSRAGNHCRRHSLKCGTQLPGPPHQSDGSPARPLRSAHLARGPQLPLDSLRAPSPAVRGRYSEYPNRRLSKLLISAALLRDLAEEEARCGVQLYRYQVETRLASSAVWSPRLRPLPWLSRPSSCGCDLPVQVSKILLLLAFFPK